MRLAVTVRSLTALLALWARLLRSAATLARHVLVSALNCCRRRLSGVRCLSLLSRCAVDFRIMRRSVCLRGVTTRSRLHNFGRVILHGSIRRLRCLCDRLFTCWLFFCRCSWSSFGLGLNLGGLSPWCASRFGLLDFFRSLDYDVGTGFLGHDSPFTFAPSRRMRPWQGQPSNLTHMKSSWR